MIAVKKPIDLTNASELGLELYDDSQFGLDLSAIYSCNTDLLCILMQKLGNDPDQWYTKTYMFSEIYDIIRGRLSIPAIEPHSVEWATRIKSYYKNKYLLNRFKNIPVSKFQQTVESIISQNNTITEEQIRPLLKLPFFYLEDIAVEEIVKNNVSVTGIGASIDDNFVFTNKICRFGKINDRYFRFFLQNSNKKLLSVKVKNNSNSYPLWNHLLETQASISFKGVCNVERFKGTQFRFYDVVNHNYTIKVNNK
jgi:hypothetical protein